MPITIPTIDDRDYRQILAETRARIPVHNPEWTNFNDSDPGMTLLQLFAFMTENLLYRANLIPERNRLKFLKLLGIPLRPATAAQGVVTIQNEKGPLETVTLPAGLPVFAGKIGFITQNALDILPIEAKLFIRRALSEQEKAEADKTYKQLYGATAKPDEELEYYETTPIEPPASGAAITAVKLSEGATVDRSLWLALLTRPREENLRDTLRAEIAGKTLTLGIMPAVDDPRRRLAPGGARPTQASPLIFEISTGALGANNEPIYQRLDIRADDDALENLTLVQITLPQASQFGVWDDLDPLVEGAGDFPPSLEDDKLKARIVAWIRLRLPAETAPNSPIASIKASYSWAGVNAARVTQRIDVAGEPVGAGSGEPDQVFFLVNKPAIPNSVVVFVNGEVWDRVEDLLAAGPEIQVRDPILPPGTPDPPPRPSKVFAIDAESGELRFGNGLQGARPPAGALIFASYAYGGGRAGNVGIGSIKNSPVLPAGYKVANPLPTWGGDDGESVAEGERNIPLYLRHRDRAVSEDDFADIVRRTPGIVLGRVEALPVFHPDIGSPSPGVVTVLVIPVDPNRPEAPKPDRFFLDAVCDYLEPKRLITTEVWVTGPDYVELSVSVGIDVVPGKDVAPVRERVKDAIRTFLSPLVGGQDESGWPLDKTVEDRELWARAARVEGVAKVRDLFLYDKSNARVSNIELRGLQLPYLTRIAVALGAPEDLTAAQAAPPPTPKKRVPVPVLPKEC